MPVTITITADTGAEAREQLEALLTPPEEVFFSLARPADAQTEARIAGGLRDIQKVYEATTPASTEPEAPVRARAPRAKKAEATEAERPQPSAPAEDAGESAVPSETELSGSATPASDAVTYDHVRTAILAVSEAGGRDAVSSVLDQFGTDHANKVAPEQWSELIDVANAKVAAIKSGQA